MSRLIARILLSIFLFPLASIIYLVVFVVGENYNGLRLRDDVSIMLAGCVTFVFIAAYWVLLWRRSVNWTGSRRSWTFGALIGAMFLGVVLGAAVGIIDDDVGRFVGTVTGPMLWLVATAFVWRETAAERSARVAAANVDAVVCPNCGYNLTGLREARCPECGAQFTLDQLLSDQPSRVSAELEK